MRLAYGVRQSNVTQKKAILLADLPWRPEGCVESGIWVKSAAV